jgi:ligand-binding sensor domain-containing protein/anti-sigma regulatory factor (Ser/Thr protein kinase)
MLFCFWVFPVLYGHAQHPYFYSINDDKGLPSNEVYDLVQDDFGFMWIGTNSGLYRYDGTDFTPFKSWEQSSKSVSHLVFDKIGKLWCQNFSGQIFSVESDSLKLELDWSKRKSNFPAFRFDNGNGLWITSDSGIYHNTYGMFQPLKSQKRFEFSDVAVVDDKLFYSEKKSIGYLHKNAFHRLVFSNKPDRFNEVLETSSFHSISGRIFLLSTGKQQNSIWEIRNDSVLWQLDLPTVLGRIFSMHDDGNGKLWVCSSNGALCLSYNLQTQFGGQLFFPGKSVSDVLRDKEGNYWFSTLQDGIFIVPSTDVWIYTQENSSLADSRIRQLTKDEGGNLYLGYQNGKISRCDFSTKQISTTGFPNSSAEIQALYFDETKGQLIVAQNKTWLVDSTSLQSTFVSGISNVKAIAKINSEDFLLGAVTGAFTAKVKPIAESFYPLRNVRARAAFYESSSKSLWVCYTDGLFVGETEEKLNGSAVYGTDIAQTQNGIVWVATTNSGVLGYKNGKLVKQLNNEIGITNGFVRKIAANGNVLWIAAEHSLISYNVISGKQKAYNRFDGLPSLEIADIEFLSDKILLATPKGLVEIPDNFNSENKIAPSIFVSSFAVHEHDTALTNNYTLNFADNNIRISFKGIAFRSHGEFTYKYRLLGLDTNWITTNSKSNFARYPSLPAGTYLFQVIALNEDGIASKTAATLQLQILKPFWQKWWFYVLCSLVLVGIVSLLFALRIHYIKRKSELEKRMANSQLAALKSQMNPHFMFNALNSIQDLVLQQDTENAQLYLGKFSELTRKVLEASGAEFISLQKEMEMLLLYLDLEKLRFGSQMQYRINADENIEADEIQLPSMIIQPFVENALKHGLLHKQGKKKLHISFTQKEKTLVCVVDDNGIGRTASAEINARKQKHKSFATEATTERLRLLNEFHSLSIELEIMDKPEGTMVILRMPLKGE